MNFIIWFSILSVSCLIVIISQFIARKSAKKEHSPVLLEIEPFKISEYFNRMEQTTIDILNEQNQIDKTIILWWGLDGLRLNENESFEWIIRKKQKLNSQNIFYQPCQSIQNDINSKLMLCNQTQSIRTQIEELMMQNMVLQNQAAQYIQNATIINMLTPHIPPKFSCYSPCMQPQYMATFSYPVYYPLMQCCCNYSGDNN